MAFPEQVTAAAASRNGGNSSGPFYQGGIYYSAWKDAADFIRVSSSPDGVTWTTDAQGPKLDFIHPSFQCNFYAGNLWFSFADQTGVVGFVKYTVATKTFAASTLTALPTVNMNNASMVISSDRMIILGSEANPATQAQYLVFNILTLTAGVWINVGPVLASYFSTRTIGVVAGLGGRIHFIGAAVDNVLFNDWMWCQTYYPATATLIAVNIFGDADATYYDIVLTPASILPTTGTINVYRTNDGGATFQQFSGVSADTVVFSSSAIPAMPDASYIPIGQLANTTGGIYIIRKDVAGVATFKYATWDGSTFGAWTAIGASATLSGAAFQMWAEGLSFAVQFVGSVYFWGFLGSPIVAAGTPLVFIPFPGSVPGAVSTLPVSLPDPTTSCCGGENKCKQMACCGYRVQASKMVFII